ncbi:MAG: 30S ribosomal protein S16 [Candidatus Peribacteraceae bacterium]|nr:30S ribosomal protein S16 [Candidatus Peribacteraceae bacterium]
MLVLRLQRTGRKNEPSFRIVLADSRKSAKGKFNEVLGHYLPSRETPVFECDTERVTHWISRGAIPSDTLARLLKRAGVKDMDTFIERYAKRKPKKAPPEEAAPPPAPAPAEVKKEAEEQETKVEKEKEETKEEKEQKEPEVKKEESKEEKKEEPTQDESDKKAE